MKAVAIVFGGFALILAVSLGFAYTKRNQIIDRDEQAKARWGDIQAMSQRRLDLIPNLVSTVEGAGKYEAATLEKIVEKRNQMLAIAQELRKSPTDLEHAERRDKLNTELFGAIRAFTGVATEAYPDLKAADAYRDLMSQLEGTENRIAVARRDFNAAAAEYNALVRKWGWMPFCSGNLPKPVFDASPEAKEAPKVKFN